MKKIFIILLFLPIISFAQQKGGAGHDNGWYRKRLTVYLAADSTTLLTNANQWYKLNARMLDGSTHGFILKDSLVIFDCSTSMELDFWGNSEYSIDKAAIFYYGLCRNSEAGAIDTSLVSSNSTTEEHKNAITQINITRSFTVNAGDTLYVKVMSNQANTTITLTRLNLLMKD